MTFVETASAFWTLAAAQLDGFGTCGLALGFAAGMMPRRGLILLAAAACSACFGLHFLRLGATTGAAMSSLSVLQCLVSARFLGGGRRPAWVALLFAASALAALATAAATWCGWPSALAVTGSLLATTGRMRGDADAMRRLFLGSSLAWAGHNAMVGSVCGLTCDVLTLAGLVIALVRSRGPRPAMPVLELA